MLREILVVFCLAYSSVQSASTAARWKYLGHTCSGARDDTFGQVVYDGPNGFIAGVKLVHASGFVGCSGAARSNWGCRPNTVDISMTVTDERNQIIYPAPRLVSRRTSGWYHLPGFTSSSAELVLADFGNPTYLKKDDKLRVWYGEDLTAHTESNNHGRTCMYVYVYKL